MYISLKPEIHFLNKTQNQRTTEIRSLETIACCRD